MIENIYYWAAAFILAIAFTPLVIKLATKKGFVSKPRSDRWHQKETALLGGVAIFLAFFIPAVIFAIKTNQFGKILFCLTLMFILGLIDDLYKICARKKLLAQTLIAFLVVIITIIIPDSLLSLAISALVVLWIVGITNAFNLIDNMDGLSAGISALTILPMLAINAYFNQTALFAINSIFLAATAGFLFYNFNPAKIFMGDAGSLFIGFFLSISAIGMISQSPLPTEQMVIATLLIFFVPLFDMSYVTIMRKIHGRKITIGGKDHTSHRLAVITKSEQMPVLILYFLNILAGMAGWWLITRNFIFFTGTVALLIICSVYIFFRVAKINVYQN